MFPISTLKLNSISIESCIEFRRSEHLNKKLARSKNNLLFYVDAENEESYQRDYDIKLYTNAKKEDEKSSECASSAIIMDIDTFIEEMYLKYKMLRSTWKIYVSND